MEDWKRKQKRKQKEAKKREKRSLYTKDTLLKRDPSKLLVEIERLRALEARCSLDGPGRQKRKHLEDQFAVLVKARRKADLECPVLLPYDPDHYSNSSTAAASGDATGRKYGELHPTTSKAAAPRRAAGHIYRPWPKDEELFESFGRLPPFQNTSQDKEGKERGKDTVDGNAAPDKLHKGAIESEITHNFPFVEGASLVDDRVNDFLAEIRGETLEQESPKPAEK